MAGAGALPGKVIAACREIGREYLVLAFEGSADPDKMGNTHIEWIRMSSLSTALESARREGVAELVLVGKIPRPNVVELIRDVRSAKFMAKVGTRILGDDSILSAVVKELEEVEGFKVVGPETILKGLLASPGVYGEVTPSKDDIADVHRCLEVVHAIGSLDIGQAAIVQNGLVLGVEGAEGTDRLINRCAEFLDPNLPGGVLVKAAKPGQDLRVDLPAVGLSTVENAIRAGLAGIACEVERVLILDRVDMVQAADAAGIYLIGTSR